MPLHSHFKEIIATLAAQQPSQRGSSNLFASELRIHLPRRYHCLFASFVRSLLSQPLPSSNAVFRHTMCHSPLNQSVRLLLAASERS